MRVSWLIGAIVCLFFGIFFTITLIGAVIGIPLIIVSVILLIAGFILPGQKKEVQVHIHHHKK